MILLGADVDCYNQVGNTPLHLAIGLLQRFLTIDDVYVGDANVPFPVVVYVANKIFRAIPAVGCEGAGLSAAKRAYCADGQVVKMCCRDCRRDGLGGHRGGP